VRDYSRLESTAFPRDRMAALKVLVVGAGALGNEVIKNLALLGVGRLSILDKDRIEASNLTRSVLFCTSDVQAHITRGTPKAELAARRAQEINPDVDANAHVAEIADLGAGRVRPFDLIFSCVDNEMARLELSWLCTRLDKPLIDGGLGLINSSSGLISLFPGAAGPCYACRKGAERRRMLLVELQGREDPCGLKERVGREAAVVPTTPVMASIVGAMQVESGIRYVLGVRDSVPDVQGVSQRITLHPKAGLETITFVRSPNCPLHQQESLVREVTERADRVSAEWTSAELLAETGNSAAFLNFDWPITARALCRSCAHAWEPMLRRARFRREHCPRCSGVDVAETEVLTGLNAASPWAGRSLLSLGLPAGHIHEVVLGTDPEAARRHIEVTGDLLAARQEVHT
jgi:molybdopterin/thiamine biosynthesis adenylyltransferase